MNPSAKVDTLKQSKTKLTERGDDMLFQPEVDTPYACELLNVEERMSKKENEIINLFWKVVDIDSPHNEDVIQTRVRKYNSEGKFNAGYHFLMANMVPDYHPKLMDTYDLTHYVGKPYLLEFQTYLFEDNWVTSKINGTPFISRKRKVDVS